MNEVVRVAAATEDEAVAWIAQALDEADFAKEADSYRLAKQFGLEIGPIKSVWDQERREAKARLAEDRAKLSQLAARLAKVKPASFFVSRPQPIRVEKQEHTEPAGRVRASPFDDLSWVAEERRRREASMAASAAEPEQRIEPSKALVVVKEPPPLFTADHTIAAMNKHHAIIDNVGGKTVIACWEPSPLDPSKLVVVFQTKDSFLLRYSNKRISLGTISVPIGQYWLGHNERQQFRGVTFVPAGPKILNECLNLWQGWGVEAKRGDWGLIRRHIEEVVASGNEEFADYIIRWIAWSIQHPDQQAEVALVLIGAKGAGKGTLARCLQPIFGAHAFQVTSREEVIGKFNGHLQDCILFVADEAYWGGDKRCVGRLQGMITETTLPIERKGIDVVQVRNYLHVVMLAEPGWVIPAGRYERRYAAFAVSTKKRGDRAYFSALHRQMSSGGIEAMLYDLREMKLNDWHPRNLPEAVLTSLALQKQQGHTLPPLEQWYVMLLHNGVLPEAMAGRPSTAFTKSLIDDARQKVPRLRELTEVGLRNFLIDEESIGVACTKYRASIGNGWTFPPLTEAREAWSRRYGPVKWDNAEALDWGKKPKPPKPPSILDRRV